MKSSYLRYCQAHSQNKGLSEYQRRVSWLQTGPSPTRGREAGWQQPEPERGNLGPRDSILHQTASRLPVANQMFLGSWTVDIHWVTARDQLPRGDTGHMWDGAPAALPGNQAAGTGEVIRCTAHLGRVHSPSTWSPELGRAQNAGPTKYVPLWSTREPEPEQLRPGTCTQPRARFR